MPGYIDKQDQTFDKMPTEAWLHLESGKTFIVDIHTVLLPETHPSGVWGHMVPVKGKNKPSWTADLPKESCPFCKHNAAIPVDQRTKDGVLYFKMSRKGFAVASIVAEYPALIPGKPQAPAAWLDKPVTAMLESGPEFWQALALEETSVSTPDEMEPDKKVLAPDWRTWHVRIEATKDGKKVKAIAPTAQHPLYTPPQDAVDTTLGYIAKRCTPWDNAEDAVKRAKEAVATPQAPAQPAHPFLSPNQAEFNRIATLGVKVPTQDGSMVARSVARWNETVVTKYGKAFAELPEDKQLAIIAGLKVRAEEQGISTDKPKSKPVDDLAELFD